MNFHKNAKSRTTFRNKINKPKTISAYINVVKISLISFPNMYLTIPGRKVVVISDKLAKNCNPIRKLMKMDFISINQGMIFAIPCYGNLRLSAAIKTKVLKFIIIIILSIIMRSRWQFTHREYGHSSSNIVSCFLLPRDPSEFVCFQGNCPCKSPPEYWKRFMTVNKQRKLEKKIPRIRGGGWLAVLSNILDHSSIIII